ncbi:MAG: 3-oxoacyl-ACP reductase FabG [Legionella sp.]|uniref:3-oxoacyl-ACP reductase FabG n=1 Tax=Legionella sp. TaxID=459 RepID=UPI002847BE60|nr:3-oxoacyl-ACP reductase FabG [Legionella sp.]
MHNLEGKVALVTGASRGIGQAIAIKLAQRGAFVYGTATTEKGAELITEYFKKENLNGKGLVLDVTNSEKIEQVVDSLTETSHAPAILVNNAGITADNLLLRMDDDEWFKVIDTNLNSIYRMSKICIKSMFRARWGRIISIGSVVGSSGNTGQVNYTAAKAGIVGFSKSLAQEIGSRNITVNVVAPGFIDTDMTTSLPDMVKNEMMKRIALRKLGQPEDIANAVAFLASDDAKYITGSTIHVNGGMYMD